MADTATHLDEKRPIEQPLPEYNNKEFDSNNESISRENSSHNAGPREPADPDTALEQTVTTESVKYPPMAKILLIMLSLYVSMFLVALVSPAESRNIQIHGI